MSRTAIRLLALTGCATALVMSVAVPADAKTAKSAHFKHARYVTHRGFAPAFQPRPAYSSDVCPGSGRSFECKIWPPPFDQDPDRKVSGTDGG